MFGKKKDATPTSDDAGQNQEKKRKISLPSLGVPPLWVSLPVVVGIASLSIPALMRGSEGLGVFLITVGFLLAVGAIASSPESQGKSEYNTRQHGS